MATAAVKEAVAHRIQAAELKQGPWRPTPLYLGALAVLHGTAADQVSREIKYLAAKLAVGKGARSEGKIRNEKINEGCHPAGIPTKPLQGKEFEFKRGRLLGLRVTLHARPSYGVGVTADASGPVGENSRARGALPDSAPGTWSRVVERLLGRGRG